MSSDSSGQPIIDKWSNVISIFDTHEDFTFHEAGERSLGEKGKASVKGLYEALRAGYTCQIGYSSGKDSESCLNLFLIALITAVRQGVPISKHHFILHADTGVENPEVQQLAKEKLSALDDFIRKHDLPLSIVIATPGYAQSWVGRVLTGRGLPTFASSKNRQCSQDLKISPANKARREHLKKLPKSERNNICLVLGSRDDESARRAASIKKFGGSDVQVSQREGGAEIYPVKSWTTENIWEFLLNLGDNKPLPCYTNSLVSTAELYKDATGECIWTTANQQQSSSCGSRFGCFTCQAAGDDKSMSNMLKNEDRYAYMRQLYRIQQLLAKTRYDWSFRNPVGRTIYEGGYIRWQPDVYSVEFTERLLRACLTADYLEQKRAEMMVSLLANGELEINEWNMRMLDPQFRIVNEQDIIMIDFVWSLHNYHSTPFKALEIYKDVWENGNLETLDDVPDMEPATKTPMPTAKWVHVGDDWIVDPRASGLVDFTSQMVVFDSDTSTLTRPVNTKYGERELINANEDLELSIDAEGAYFILHYEYDRLIEIAESQMFSPTEAAHYYLRIGTISIARGKIALYDRMAIRGQRYRELGISGHQSINGPDPSAGLQVLSNKEYQEMISTPKCEAV